MKSRNFSLDLLKILCMILIVAHHFSLYSNLSYNSSVFSNRDIFLNLIALGGKFGVNVFMLISGYFLYSSKFKIKKLLHLEFVTLFFSITIYLIFAVLDGENFSWNQLIINAMPTTFGRYWFIKAYMFVYLLSPFTNLILHKIKKKQFYFLISILITFGSIMPTFSNLIARNAYFDNTFWLLIIYVVGAFFKKFDSDFKNKKLYFVLSFTMLFILILGCFVTYKYNLQAENKFSMNFYSEAYHFPILIISIYFFLLFKSLTVIKFGPAIFRVSSLMFGVYLIHENLYIRGFLWGNLASFLHEKQGLIFIIESFLFLLATFISCTVLEHLRSKLLNKSFNKVELFISNKINKYFQQF